MGHVRLKTKSSDRILEKSCICGRDQIFGVKLMKLGQVFASMKSYTFFKMGHVGSTTRSLGQIIEDPMLVTKGL